MNSTETTPAPAVGGRQVGQLLAGRYRLAMFKGGDEIADVWHALDESTEKVVTLEILRDRSDDAAKQRFLAEAQRMAAIERPSVMRVAAIHNEPTETFIVFEHLIPLPVVLTGLTAIAKDTKPATKAAEDKTGLLAPSTPQAPASVVPSPLASVAGPLRSGATLDGSEVGATAPAIVDLDVPPITAYAASALPETLGTVSSPLTAVRSELSGLAHGVVSDMRDVVRDAGLDELVAAARARIPRGLDTSPLTSLAARVTALAARVNALAARVTAIATRVTAIASRVAAPVRSFGSAAATARAPLPSLRRTASRSRPASARVAEPAKNETAPIGAALPTIIARVGAVLPAVLSIPLRAGSASLRLIGRIRVSPVVLAGLIGILVLIAFVMSPLDDAIVSALRSATASSSAAPTVALAPAPFDVPPLGAYGAAFESQGAYPTTTPNGTIEWVVALRNTGSAGWYRGIDGAQAALALPDGTGVAVQSTPYVAPGQVGWFVVHFRARAELGTYNVELLPRIDGRGPLPNLGIYAVVTVSKNP